MTGPLGKENISPTINNLDLRNLDHPRVMDELTSEIDAILKTMFPASLIDEVRKCSFEDTQTSNSYKDNTPLHLLKVAINRSKHTKLLNFQVGKEEFDNLKRKIVTIIQENESGR